MDRNDTAGGDGQFDRPIPTDERLPLRHGKNVTWATELSLVVAGILVPIASFLFGQSFSPGGDLWQSGRHGAYASLLLIRGGPVPMYPFLLYSMLCLATVTLAKERAAKYFLVRIGIYTGTLLAIQYWGLFSVSFGQLMGGPGSMAGAAVIASIALIAGAALWGMLLVLAIPFSRNQQVAVGLLVIAAATLLIFSGLMAGEFWQIPTLVLILFSTTWAVVAYAFLSVMLLLRKSETKWQFTLAQLLGITTWFAGYLAAWKISITNMWSEYAKLPATPPDGCYVCTAASRGHPWLVGRCQAASRDDVTHGTNRQTQILRRFEREVLCQHARGHRVLRAVYNRVGPLLASMLFCPILADLAYLSLKPAEWTARLLLLLRKAAD